MSEFMKYMMAFSMFMNWFEEAKKDKVIDAKEGLEFLEMFVATFGDKVKIKL